MTASFKNKNKANHIENNCDEFVEQLQESKTNGKENQKGVRPARFESAEEQPSSPGPEERDDMLESNHKKTGNFGAGKPQDPNLETPTANTEARNHSPDRRKADQELQDKLELEKQEKEKISNELVAREKALADEQDSKAKLEDYLK